MNVKKRGYLSFLLGVVMMFAFAIPAFAADTGKLVINGQTYQSKGPHILLAVGNEDMESVVLIMVMNVAMAYLLLLVITAQAIAYIVKLTLMV